MIHRQDLDSVARSAWLQFAAHYDLPVQADLFSECAHSGEPAIVHSFGAFYVNRDPVTEHEVNFLFRVGSPECEWNIVMPAVTEPGPAFQNDLMFQCLSILSRPWEHGSTLHQIVRNSRVE